MLDHTPALLLGALLGAISVALLFTLLVLAARARRRRITPAPATVEVLPPGRPEADKQRTGEIPFSPSQHSAASGAGPQRITRDEPSAQVSRHDEAGALYELLVDSSLLHLVERIQTLPTQQQTYREVLKETLKPEPSIYVVGHLLSQDIGLATRVLRLVNSAYFGLRRYISSPTEAITLLGLDTIRALLLSMNIFDDLEQQAARALPVGLLHTHSLAVAAYAKRIAQYERSDARIIDHCFTAGLLHDVGKLVLAANLPEEYLAASVMVKTETIDRLEAERRVFGATHAELGAYLLDLWDLPVPVVEAVAYHHRPREHDARGFSPVAAVSVGNAMEHLAAASGAVTGDLDVDGVYLARLGVLPHLPDWQDRCQEVLVDEL